MENSKYYPLALEALVELAPEIAASRNEVRSSRPKLEEVLNELGALPAGALFLGMAEDGLPVLLNLYDSQPGPLLLIGDQQTGKTAMLKTLASSACRTYSSDEIQFSVATNNPGEWEGLEQLPHCAGVVSMENNDARELITSLYDWAHQNGRSQQVVLFFVDGLEKADQWDETAKSQFRWLLMRGPARCIWPILTLNSSMISDAKEWLSLLKTFIYGKIADASLADMYTGASKANLSELREGSDFTMREGNHWLRFWIPSIS